LDLAVARALIRKLPVRNDSEIRFKSAVRHISNPAPSVPESALNSANLAAALPFPFHVSVSAVLSHLVFIRIICDIEIDSGVTVTSGRGRVLLQRGSSFCVIDPVSFDALPPPPDKFSSFSSYVSKDSYPCFLRVQSNDLSMFSYSLEAVRSQWSFAVHISSLLHEGRRLFHRRYMDSPQLQTTTVHFIHAATAVGAAATASVAVRFCWLTLCCGLLRCHSPCSGWRA
jgi:hypothetical protein